MGISDKTRKIIWGKSGNRCAICRNELVVDATSLDDESIIGEECHIISYKTRGPRYVPNEPLSNLDEPNNLLLLCRIHHKIVDDQTSTYNIEQLRKIKSDHENWVSSTLTGQKKYPPIRIKKVKGGSPDLMVRMLSGRDIWQIVNGSMGYSFDHDEPKSEAEVDLISGFFQEMQNWGERSSGLEAGEGVKISFRFSELMRELENAGFWIFGAREVRVIEGGIGDPTPFNIAVVRVVRSENSEIIKINLADLADDKTNGAT